NYYTNSSSCGNLISNFTQTSGSYQQQVNLYGTARSAVSGAGTTLTINQTRNTSFGYGLATSLTSTIQGPGSIILNGNGSGALTLTGPNTYLGTTTISPG